MKRNCLSLAIGALLVTGFASAQDVVEMMQARDTAMGVAAE